MTSLLDDFTARLDKFLPIGLVDMPIRLRSLKRLESDYSGEAYGVIAPSPIKAMTLCARLEGVIFGSLADADVINDALSQ